MNSNECLEQLREMSDYFGKKLTNNQVAQYYESLKYIPIKDFTFAVKSIIENGKPMQSNFPTIADIKAFCPFKRSIFDVRSNETEQEYYQRVAVSHLLEALNILERQGEEIFLNHCKKRHFSADDISRVKVKHHLFTKKENAEQKISKMVDDIGN